MSSNVGLSTPRGTGTSGYVQRNLSLLKPRDTGAGAPYSTHDRPPRQRKPDASILRHDRLREIEVSLISFRDQLEDEAEKDGKELDDDEVDELVEAERKRLMAEMERDEARGKAKSGVGGLKGKGLKSYQVHELAEAKERESEKLRKALGLKGDELGEDGEHPMARQEKRRRREREDREAKEVEEEDGEGERDGPREERRRERR